MGSEHQRVERNEEMPDTVSGPLAPQTWCWFSINVGWCKVGGATPIQVIDCE
jgi:hypothetical protein